MTVETLFKEFIKLKKEDKKNFMDQVLDFFLEKKEEGFPAISTTLSKEQIKEVEDRVESIQTGEGKTYTWEEVKKYAIQKNENG